MKAKVDRLGPVRRYTLVPSGDEPDYMRCTWGVIYLDLEKGILSAVTDTGDYAYRWPEHGRDFMRLMIDVLTQDDEYLIKKIARRTVFDLEESKLLVADSFRGDDDPDTKKLLDRVAEIDAHSPEAFISALDDLGCTDSWEYVVETYSPQATFFVELMQRHILPLLREEYAHDED
ncbi:MAG: hypothetical protein Q4E13_10405 [Clostridia bacterium]|nr:hypothetical protein [Clostridia bacterium]